MFLYFAMKYPEIVSTANYVIQRFLVSEAFRTKTSVPNLGEFLALLTITTSYRWEDIREAYLEVSYAL
mgnify:CR=1 FL=1